MEGIVLSSNQDVIDKLIEYKKHYLICSFSHSQNLTEPLLWCHYANGFRGIAIEISVECEPYNSNKYHLGNGDYINKIRYYKKDDFHKIKENLNAEKVITRKLDTWDYEGEYRYIKKGKEKGSYTTKNTTISKVYFGEPYNVSNKEDIIEASDKLKEYYRFRDDLKKFCDHEKIPTCNAYYDAFELRIKFNET